MLMSETPANETLEERAEAFHHSLHAERPARDDGDCWICCEYCEYNNPFYRPALMEFAEASKADRDQLAREALEEAGFGVVED